MYKANIFITSMLASEYPEWEAVLEGHPTLFGRGWTPRQAAWALVRNLPAHELDLRWDECRMILTRGEARYDDTDGFVYRMSDSEGRDYLVLAETPIGAVGITKDYAESDRWFIRVNPQPGALLSIGDSWTGPGKNDHWSNERPFFGWRYVATAVAPPGLSELLEEALVAIGYYQYVNTALVADDESLPLWARVALFRPVRADGAAVLRDRRTTDPKFAKLFEDAQQAIYFASRNMPKSISFTEENARGRLFEFLTQNGLMAEDADVIAAFVVQKLRSLDFGAALTLCAVTQMPSWIGRSHLASGGNAIGTAAFRTYFVETSEV